MYNLLCIVNSAVQFLLCLLSLSLLLYILWENYVQFDFLTDHSLNYAYDI